MTRPAPTITCVECGGIAHLISFLPDDEVLDPDIPLAYLCEDCGERFDLVWTEEEDD